MRITNIGHAWRMKFEARPRLFLVARALLPIIILGALLGAVKLLATQDQRGLIIYTLTEILICVALVVAIGTALFVISIALVGVGKAVVTLGGLLHKAASKAAIAVLLITTSISSQ